VAAKRCERDIRASQQSLLAKKVFARPASFVWSEEIVRSFLDEFDGPQRIVFYLSDIEGMRAPEIAEALGVNLGTAHARIRLARNRFEREIARRMEADQPS
jgi:DNA-directed RNA polymerase specialized sigma24 family protein